MENIWEMSWAGIEALRPVSMMPARLLIVPIRQSSEISCDNDHILGGVRCLRDAAVLANGICSDAVYPPLNNRRTLQLCFFN